ncbi:hypothetical protein CASFOL_026638 [Castilleja foliolosa]|uniref:Glycosyltransferase n=1 Tax=Castilleja foliolosa TaxID=1961234 RepID=A0ABD3CJB3_9LAMI
MATTTTSPHLALFPCSGMGHLLPFLRLSAMLATRNCTVTLITAHPTVSSAESHHLSTFLTTHPTIKHLQYQLIPHQNSNLTNNDPFFVQIESIDNSIHLLAPLLSSLSPPISAIIADFPITTSITDLSSKLSIPTYIVITTSARFFTLMTHLPHLKQHNKNENYTEIPFLGPIAVSNIPPPMLNPNHFFSANICSNISSLSKVEAFLINTFTWFEPDAINALRSKIGLSQKILPIGPLEPFETEPEDDNHSWLDGQAEKSVLFVSFGSRTALSVNQIRELANGLEKSGYKFLWALKLSKVDKDDNEKIEDILGESFLARTEDKGVIVKGWVNQERILAHPAIGGFVSHCGWNSVVEAARLGVPVLAWPQHGDQRVNAEVVEKVGLGLWASREWGWGGEKLVGENEIVEKIRELMVNTDLRDRVKEVKIKAGEAREVNGSSEVLVRGLIESLKSKETNAFII